MSNLAIDTMQDALSGIRGPDQQRIAAAGLDWIATILAKNADYGSSAWDIPCLAPECDAGTAIRVRMSDKINRVKSLLSKPAEVVSESLEDTIKDLGAYCLLWLARPRSEQWVSPTEVELPL